MAENALSVLSARLEIIIITIVTKQGLGGLTDEPDSVFPFSLIVNIISRVSLRNEYKIISSN